MKFTTTAFAASALSLASLVSAQAVINTPSQLFTCEPAAISASSCSSALCRRGPSPSSRRAVGDAAPRKSRSEGCRSLTRLFLLPRPDSLDRRHGPVLRPVRLSTLSSPLHERVLTRFAALQCLRRRLDHRRASRRVAHRSAFWRHVLTRTIPPCSSSRPSSRRLLPTRTPGTSTSPPAPRCVSLPCLVPISKLVADPTTRLSRSPSASPTRLARPSTRLRCVALSPSLLELPHPDLGIAFPRSARDHRGLVDLVRRPGLFGLRFVGRRCVGHVGRVLGRVGCLVRVSLLSPFRPSALPRAAIDAVLASPCLAATAPRRLPAVPRRRVRRPRAAPRRAPRRPRRALLPPRRLRRATLALRPSPSRASLVLPPSALPSSPKRVNQPVVSPRLASPSPSPSALPHAPGSNQGHSTHAPHEPHTSLSHTHRLMRRSSFTRDARSFASLPSLLPPSWSSPPRLFVL